MEKTHIGVTPILSEVGHLACYKIKPLGKGFCAPVDPDDPTDYPQLGDVCGKDSECGDGLFCKKDTETQAHLFNQFGDEKVDVDKAYELCVPSTKTVGVSGTSTQP